MGIRVKIGNIDIRNVGGLNWAAYWGGHTSFYGTGRSGLTIPDDYGNDAKILPAMWTGTGTMYYVNAVANIFSSDNWVLNFEVILNNAVGQQTFVAQGGFYFKLRQDQSKWYLYMNDGVGGSQDVDIPFATLPLTNRKYLFKIVHTQASTTVYENSIQVGKTTAAFTNVANGQLNFGSIANTISFIRAKIYSDVAETTLVAYYEFTGESIAADLSGNLYDLIGVNHTTAAKGYNIEGSQYLLDNGYALWQKAAAADIYVPSGGKTTAPSAGYTLTKNYEGSGTKINMAPCLIGFNETSSVAVALEIFDRSNVTRQTAASRASAYYSATSLATKSRYHISEVYPHEVFTTLFETDYQDIVFTSISKTGTDFSINAFRGCTEKQTGRYLTKIKAECQIDGLLTVGTDKNVVTINQAITRAYDDYIITIDAATYPEALNLTTKTINFVGLGSLTTIVYNSADITSTVVNIATNSTFTNILFRKRGQNINPIINISAANPIFTDCKLYKPWGTDYAPPMSIDNASVVNMVNCDIDVLSEAGVNFSNLTVKGGSIFNLTGDSFKARLLVQDTSIANVTVDEFWTSVNAAVAGLTAENDAVVNLTIITQEILLDLATGLQTVGSYACPAYNLYDNAQLELNGNNITGQVPVIGDNINVLLKDIISPYGAFWVHSVLDNSLITFNNSQIKHDAYTADGSHIIESDGLAEVVINASILEFISASGLSGQPVEAPYLYMRDSQVIFTVDDDITSSYTQVLRGVKNIDIENSILTLRNWTVTGGTFKYSIIKCIKTTGTPLNIRLVGVTFESDVVTGNGGFAFEISGNAIEAGDYIIASGLINNTQEVNICNDMTKWNLLISQAP